MTWKKLWAVVRAEDGQDLVEYALLVVLIALGAVIGMQGLTAALNSTFIAAGTNLTSNT